MRKFQLIIITVMRIVNIFIIKVKRRYLAINGIVIEVGGRIFETSRRNTTKASKMDIHMVIFSPASAGK